MTNAHVNIIEEIDTTIDQLLENAKVLKKISADISYQTEMLALEKTQESLIAHLIHLDELLKKKDPSSFSQQKPLLNSKVHHKLGRCGYLNHKTSKKEHNQDESAEHPPRSKKPKIHKRRASAEQL